MSCILRLIGTNLDVDSIQSKITIAIDSSWKKGEPRFSQKENSKLHEVNSSTKCNAVKKTCRRNKPMPFTRSVV